MANYTKREERAAASHADAARARAIESSPKSRARSREPPTLGYELRGPYKWFWFWCPRCSHRSAVPLAPRAIRFGFNVPVLDVAKFATCTRCGHTGALLQRPHMERIGDQLVLEPIPSA